VQLLPGKAHRTLTVFQGRLTVEDHTVTELQILDISMNLRDGLATVEIFRIPAVAA
jgi:hypothetical protein